jgi:endonuclease/exonuclease/phosphatase (EEP) superfamily protein YafD
MTQGDDEPRTKQATPPRIAIPRRLAKATAWTLAAGSLVHPLATSLALLDWRADLLTTFREPALALSLVAAASMARIRRVVAVGIGLLALWQAWGLSTCYRPNPVPPDSQDPARLRIISANVLCDNVDPRGMIDLVRSERPDILGMMEVSSPWIEGLEPIRSEFPYRYDYPSDDEGTGLSLWFRTRPIAVEFLPKLHPCGMPAIRAVIDFAGKPRHLWLVHLVSPFKRAFCLKAGDEFADLVEKLRRDGGSALAFGDFNCSDGSPYFARFIGQSGLRDSRLGFGRQRSWPTWSPYRISIDHAFLTPDLAVEDRRLGPSIGSDHFPLLLDLAPAASPEAKAAAQASQSSSVSGSAEANLTRSAPLRNATSRSTSTGSNVSSSAGSSPISSVVFEPQAGPKAPIKAPRTTSDDAINR